jgi:L-methionine (R)-S-oxide reductase
MREGIDLPPIPRGTVLSEHDRAWRLELAAPQILAAVHGERDPIVVEATLAALLWETLGQASWVGFYRRVGEATLSVGPYQGPMGCLHIDFARGVCGACARTRAPVRVPDVRAFPGHIACDDATMSELVLPVLGGGELRAVLDLDSHLLDAFSDGEQRKLEALLEAAFDARLVW